MITVEVYENRKGKVGVLLRFPQEIAAAFAVGNDSAMDGVRAVIAEALESDSGKASGLVK